MGIQRADVGVFVKALHPLAKLPTFAKPGDACADLYATEERHLVEGDGFVLVPTGIAIELPEGWEAVVRGRSGMAAKAGISVHACTS